MKIFNFLWEKGFSEPQIRAIMNGEVNQEDIVPERMQMDENMNFSVPQEPFRGARGGIVDVLESLRPRMAGGGITGLEKAKNLLTKNAPAGESLAFINPQEANLLKSRGGSGIMTASGVPSYLSLFGWEVPGTSAIDLTGTDLLNLIPGVYIGGDTPVPTGGDPTGQGDYDTTLGLT